MWVGLPQDYFVLLPLDYYEATKLQKQFNSPCTLDHDQSERCVQFAYPDVSDFASVDAGKGHALDGSGRKSNPKLLDDSEVNIMR